MKISCESCRNQFNLPDEKVPQRDFSITCPACKERIVVTSQQAQGASPLPQQAPTQQQQPAAPAPVQPVPTQLTAPAQVAPAQAAPPDPEPSPASAGSPQDESDPFIDTGTFTRLTPLRSADLKLMEGLTPVAYVVNIDLPPDNEVTRSLQKIGMEEIKNFSDVSEACEQLQENDAAILLVRMSKASAPPCEPLEPVYKLPFDVRRRTFVALLAENVKPLDGQVAFYLQVNCLLNSQEMGALPVKLRRALLHHLRQYRFWDIEVA